MFKLGRWSMLNLLIAMMSVMVLIAVIVPIWRTLGTRQHIADAVLDASALKVVVLEAATVRGGLAEVRSNDLHYNPKASIGTYVASAEIADGGLITLHTRNTGTSPDPILMLIPSERNGKEGAEITWTCKMMQNAYALSPPDCLKQDSTQPAPANSPTPRVTTAAAAQALTRTDTTH
ncbi:hypothetical protein [Dyella telluris]|uniref:Pilin n=1 Tax=Dyella telluris TaxID=2763498 RepID=A0A7G8Q5Z1_9GAMM|nr:hypothetical protein [Dyella telluris]QNK02199.1 hypothetical protein H8F01_03260 [Dyella telluris]